MVTGKDRKLADTSAPIRRSNTVTPDNKENHLKKQLSVKDKTVTIQNNQFPRVQLIVQTELRYLMEQQGFPNDQKNFLTCFGWRSGIFFPGLFYLLIGRHIP